MLLHTFGVSHLKIVGIYVFVTVRWYLYICYVRADKSIEILSTNPKHCHLIPALNKQLPHAHTHLCIVLFEGSKLQKACIYQLNYLDEWLSSAQHSTYIVYNLFGIFFCVNSILKLKLYQFNSNLARSSFSATFDSAFWNIRIISTKIWRIFDEKNVIVWKNPDIFIITDRRWFLNCFCRLFFLSLLA